MRSKCVIAKAKMKTDQMIVRLLTENSRNVSTGSSRRRMMVEMWMLIAVSLVSFKTLILTFLISRVRNSAID